MMGAHTHREIGGLSQFYCHGDLESEPHIKQAAVFTYILGTSFISCTYKGIRSMRVCQGEPELRVVGLS